MSKNKKNNKKKQFLCNISLTKKGEGFGVSKELKKDIFIPKEKTGGALNNDLALVRIENEKYWEGRVVEIKKRAKEVFSGVVKKEKDNYYVFPKDTKAQHLKILVKSLSGQKISEEDVVGIKIKNWKNKDGLPEGEVIETLGHQGENNTEMKAIALEHGFKEGHEIYTQEESEIINKNGIKEEDIKGRRDFRGITTFTIDPDDAKDYDDAISIRDMGERKFEIGIHIADVSHYVKIGSSVDKEASRRATSVYMVDRVIPMLPETLSNDLCSLLPDKDRLTFSAIFVMDDSGKIHEKWFGKTIIHSKKRFTYDEVQKIIEKNYSQDDFSKELSTLNSIAKKLRKERILKGSVLLDSVEIKFKLDEKGVPLGIYKKEQKDAHKLVEEFMLLANKKVAEKIFKKGTKAGQLFVYRNHDLPNSDKLAGLKDILITLGSKIKTKGIGIDAKTLNMIIDEFEGKAERSLVMWIILRSMSKADYSTKNLGHFGLAFDSYTHFTSPIRRYPDIMVHRLLYSHLTGQRSKTTEKEYEELCRHSSEMERKAMEAERESIKYKQVEFVLNKIGESFQGVITGVTDWGMFVEAQEIFCEGMVSVRDMKEDYFSLDKNSTSLIGQKTNKKYRIGDAVRVELVSANLKNRTIDFRLV